MKILVTGRNGQVAKSIALKAQARGIKNVSFFGQADLDLENTDIIAPFIKHQAPDLIINTAAWTAVDDAEDAPERAHLVNTVAPYEIAKTAKAIGAQLIHISTDYVYSGHKKTPYLETDAVAPNSVYGQTKLDGETRVLETLEHALILRTAWVYSPVGKNFVKSMRSLAENRDALTVVDDQFGNPTSALDLADAILTISENWASDTPHGFGQIFHCAGTGSTDWADFARHIFNVSQNAGGPSAAITGIPSSEWPTKATRPFNSRLNCSALKESFGIEMPDWKTSTTHTVSALLNG